LTQEALAWECGFAKAYLSQVEAGKGVPSLPAMYSLAKRLGVDVVDLLACDANNPLHRVIEAIRKGDARMAFRELARLGLEPAPEGGDRLEPTMAVAEGSAATTSPRARRKLAATPRGAPLGPGTKRVPRKPY
jgi:transcriptional regulator with XRE-family HTH domain